MSKENKYTIISWPESQDLFEKDWFDECELINSEPLLSIYGPSAYFVPIDKLDELTKLNNQIPE